MPNRGEGGRRDDWTRRPPFSAPLVITTLGDADEDGLHEELYADGTRSLSLLASRGRLVFDTGDRLEWLSWSPDPASYNEDSETDNRSDNLAAHGLSG